MLGPRDYGVEHKILFYKVFIVVDFYDISLLWRRGSGEVQGSYVSVVVYNLPKSVPSSTMWVLGTKLGSPGLSHLSYLKKKVMYF